MRARQFLIAAMLVIMGERWEYAGHFGVQWCQAIDDGKCEGGVETYRRVYVIGKTIPMTQMQWMACAPSPMLTPCDPPAVEVFTIPVPNVPTKAMTKEEAALSQK